MDDAALFDLARGTALNGLDRAAHLLDVITARSVAETILGARLAPGMFTCAEQIRTTVSFAYRCVMPVIGRDYAFDDGTTLADLRAAISEARATLDAVTAEDFAGASQRVIAHRAGQADLTQSARDYLVDFAVPNLWFHLSMAYAVLRSHDVPVGKADFDGLHAYADGFRFS